MASGWRIRRLERFAIARGMQFAVGPSGERRAASFFGRSEYQDAVAWFGAPGPDGFEVAQHIERIDVGGSENEEMRRRWTWAVFTLRQAGGSADTTAAAIRPMLPHRWGVEVVESELFLMTTRPTSLTSPRMRRMLSEVRRALHPVLAQPMRTTAAAERDRRGIRHEINASDRRATRDREASV
ncbi:hypothetical protein [Microbacterium murale]|uniref:Uncharacterized protein n=1 Tax=Microbacterium murale TaxID=1081040 RepID=A0ABU0P5N6_9MICO|nr:hypothetical protein [Microbacterium murale]MDQ0642628.1 hypothetical protein [Microbacterium murale]